MEPHDHLVTVDLLYYSARRIGRSAPVDHAHTATSTGPLRATRAAPNDRPRRGSACRRVRAVAPGEGGEDALVAVDGVDLSHSGAAAWEATRSCSAVGARWPAIASPSTERIGRRLLARRHPPEGRAAPRPRLRSP
jgi:hypothetical protein